jgi:hypothetical protein
LTHLRGSFGDSVGQSVLKYFENAHIEWIKSKYILSDILLIMLAYKMIR